MSNPSHLASDRAGRRRCGRSVLAWLTGSFLWLLPAIALTQTPTGGNETGQEVRLPAEGPIASPTQSIPGLHVLWRGFLLAPDDSDTEQQAFAALEAAKFELGVPNLAHLAMVLLRQAERALATGPRERADRLVQWAMNLAPQDPAPRFAQAATMGWSRPWLIPRALSNLIQGHRLAVQAPSSAMIFGYHVRHILFFAWIGLLIVFLLVQLLRYFKLAAYDLDSILAHHVDPTLVRLLMVMVLALPALILESPLALIPLLVALVWLYQNRREKLIALLILASLGLSPLLARQMGRWVASSGTDAALLFQAENDLCEARCQSQLDHLLESHPDDPQIAFTRALVLYRSASDIDLQRAWELLSAHRFDGALQPVARLLKGNLLVLRGQLGAARQEYDRILQDADGGDALLAAAHFNLYRILQELGDPSHADHLAQAQSLDYERTVALIQGGARRVHRYLMHAGTPYDELVSRAREQGGELAATAIDEIWQPLGGLLPLHGAPILAAITLILLLVLSTLRHRLQLSRACPKCNRPMSYREAPRAAIAGYCQDCFDLFMEGASLDGERRTSLESHIDLHTSIRRWMTIGFNTILAGAGFLLQGSALLGTALVGLVAMGVALLLLQPPVVAIPFAWGQATSDGQTALALVCLVAGYGISWLTTWLNRRAL